MASESTDTQHFRHSETSWWTVLPQDLSGNKKQGSLPAGRPPPPHGPASNGSQGILPEAEISCITPLLKLSIAYSGDQKKKNHVPPAAGQASCPPNVQRHALGTPRQALTGELGRGGTEEQKDLAAMKLSRGSQGNKKRLLNK